MKMLNLVNFLESRSWPLTLALGLIFVIILSLCMNKISNGFLIFLFGKLLKVDGSYINIISLVGRTNVFRLRRTTLNNGLYRKWYKNLKIKRYYNSSYILLGKDQQIIKILGKVIEIPQALCDYMTNTFTKQNVKQEMKEQLNISHKQLKKQHLKEVVEKMAYSHKGIVEGVKFKGDDISLTEFLPITSSNKHDVVIDDMPINNISIVKSTVKNDVIKLNTDNVGKLPNEFLNLVNSKNKKVMEIVKLKDYEFFNIEGTLYMIHNQYIYRKGNLVIYIDYTKKVPVDIDIYTQVCNEVVLNPVLKNYIKLDDNLMKILSTNYEVLKNMKKD